MKKILISLIDFVFTIQILAEEAKKYGAELSLTEKTPISKILADAENFVGKKVLVEGTVVGVCAKRGCWISLSSDKEYEQIRVKVNDGEIVFPMEAKGKTAIVEGEVYSVVVEGEQCSGNCEGEHKEGGHKEGEHKEGEDNCCEKVKTKKKVYLIKGLGAVIK
ncbi:MAG: DUF4920 domain-containing protein [Melioribacteraceae bacterium]|nr:DUF4920 domain-containing protein [Melioribacteraceae bacterium]